MNFSILKIPFDKCIVEKERRGAALAPAQIEKELNDFFQFEQLKKKIKFLEVKELNDFNKLHAETEKIATNEYKRKNFVIGLGGDHSISYGLMKAFAKKFPKNSGLIYFDAHFDCQDDFLPPTHEDVLRAVVNKKLFTKKEKYKGKIHDINTIMAIGQRNFTDEERKFTAMKISWYLADMFYTNTAPDVMIEYIKEFLEERKIENLYISIDIDVIDPAFAPGTGWPEPAGIIPWQLISILQSLRMTKKVKGFDIVEVSPPKDVNNITSRLAARLVLELLK